MRRSVAPTLFTLFVLLQACPARAARFTADGHGRRVDQIEVYLADSALTPGTILELARTSASPGGALRPAFTQPGPAVTAVAFMGYGPAYFVPVNGKDIVRTDGMETRIMHRHATYIRDLAFDSRGRLFFSEASGRGGNGSIYHVDHFLNKVTRLCQVPLDEVDGYWAGTFAFAPDDRLFVSSGNYRRAGIYERVEGRFQRRFRREGSLMGFAFADADTVYFTTGADRLFTMTGFEDPSVEFQSDRLERLDDVALAVVPGGGDCGMSGRLTGGRELWPAARAEAYGPNVFWRKLDGSSSRIDRDGAYRIEGLPGGRYRLSIDVGADAPVGFQPEKVRVECGDDLPGIDFLFGPPGTRAAGSTIVAMDIHLDTGHVFAWFEGGTYTKGSSADLSKHHGPKTSTLPGGRVPRGIAGVIHYMETRRSGVHVAYYLDGTYSKGSAANPASSSGPRTYTLPPGKTPDSIVGMGAWRARKPRSTLYVYAWYRDGTYSVGNVVDLDRHAGLKKYTLPPDRQPDDIVGMGIDKRRHVYVWYRDGTASRGVAHTLDSLKVPYDYRTGE